MKSRFLHDGFSTNMALKIEFLKLGFCSISFQFWHSVSFVKDYSVSVSYYTIFQYFRVKSNLYLLRRFSLRRSYTDAVYKNNF